MIKEHVLRLEPEMQHVSFVCKLKRVTDLREHTNGEIERKLSFRLGSHTLAKIAAHRELHDKIWIFALRILIDDLDDVGMHERSVGLHRRANPAHDLVAPEITRKLKDGARFFDRHAPAEAHV